MQRTVAMITALRALFAGTSSRDRGTESGDAAAGDRESRPSAAESRCCADLPGDS